MEVGYLEILGAVLVLLLTGGISYMVHLTNRIKYLEENKVSKDSFEEVREDIKMVLAQLTDIRLEHTRWEAREEFQKELKHEKS